MLMNKTGLLKKHTNVLYITTYNLNVFYNNNKLNFLARNLYKLKYQHFNTINMKRIFLILTAAFLLSSCQTIKVVSDYDSKIDFTKYKTLQYYGLAKNSDEILNRFDKERIENAFAREFKKRGVSVVKENADIIVTLYIVTKEKTQKNATTTYSGGYGPGYYGYAYRYGYGPGWGWSDGTSYTTVTEEEYTVGTLLISVYDAKEKKLIWQSYGVKILSDKEDNREQRINLTVAKIMAKYPVKPIK